MSDSESSVAVVVAHTTPRPQTKKAGWFKAPLFNERQARGGLWLCIYRERRGPKHFGKNKKESD